MGDGTGVFDGTAARCGTAPPAGTGGHEQRTACSSALSAEPGRGLVEKVHQDGVEMILIHEWLKELGCSGSYSDVHRSARCLEPRWPELSAWPKTSQLWRRATVTELKQQKSGLQARGTRAAIVQPTGVLH